MRTCDALNDLQGLDCLDEDEAGQLVILRDHKGREALRGGSCFWDGEISPLENGIIAKIVAEVEVILKDFEEIDCADLFFELWAVIEDDVLAVGG